MKKEMTKMLTNVSSKVTTVAGRTGLKIQEKSPEILLAVGILGFVGTVVLACRATMKCEETLDSHAEMMEAIEKAKTVSAEEDEITYTEEDEKKDRVIATTKTAVAVAKNYAPAVGLGVLSLACILGSRNIMHRRYVGVLAAYNGLQEVSDMIKKRIIEEEGEEKYRHYRYGTKLEKVDSVEEDENGKKKKTKELTELMNTDAALPSETAVFFDESNPNWDPNPNFSLMFLRGKQNWANDVLRTRGHIFLNEVYDALGFDHTPAGAVLGWVKGEGDGYVDFGLYDQGKEGVRRFINGKDNIILLDFNHDGIIYNKI